MKLKIFFAALVADFAIFTGYVLYAEGLSGVLAAFDGNLVAWHLLVDLCLALFAGAVLMVEDARARGINPWPYVALMVLTGSPGGLLYLVARKKAEGASGAEPDALPSAT